MASHDDERIPGFNAPLADAGPIVSKRTGRRRDRVKEALGTPQKIRPSGRPLHQRHGPLDLDALDEIEDRPARGPLRGIAITLLVLFVLGTRGCGLLAGDSEPTAPTPPTDPPRLVERLDVPTASTFVAGDDGSDGD